MQNGLQSQEIRSQGGFQSRSPTRDFIQLLGLKDRVIPSKTVFNVIFRKYEKGIAKMFL